MRITDEQITSKKSTWESPEDEDGYGSEDDLSELEGEELEESLLRQKQSEDELMEHLMRSIGAKEWRAESNLGYGNKSSDRTKWWRQQKKREKDEKDEKSRNS